MRTVLLLAALLALAGAHAPADPTSPLTDKDRYVLLVVNEKCWDSYFTAFEWLSLGAWGDASSQLRACVVASVKKSLGYGIVAGGIAVNALQVHSVYSAGHASGMNLGSLYQSLWSNILGAVYMCLNGAAPDKYFEMLVQALGPACIVASGGGGAPQPPRRTAAIAADKGIAAAATPRKRK